MSKFSSFVLIAGVSLTLFATGAQAAQVIRGNPPPTNTPSNANGGDSTACTALCITINPPPRETCRPIPVHGPVTLSDAEPHQQKKLLVAIKPCPTGGANDTAIRACGDQLQHLRRVTVGQVRRVDEQDVVHLVPLCDTVNHTLTENQMRYLARGNVQGLIPSIDHNDTLMAELEDHGYEANDVIGIALAPDAAVLYVSHSR